MDEVVSDDPRSDLGLGSARVSSRWRLWWAIFLVALAVRGAVLWNLEAYPRFEYVANRLDDQMVFDAWAKSFVRGEIYDYATSGHEFARWAALRPGVYPQAPLYPWFVGTVYAATDASRDAVRAVQMIVGAAAAGGVAVLAAGIAGTPAAVVSGLAAAFYGPQVFYETTFLRAGLLGSIAVFTLLVLVGEGRTTDGHPRRSRLRRTGLGLLLGAGVLLRPTWLLVAAGLLSWLASRRGLRSAVLPATVLAATLLPVVALNTLRSGAPAFLSSNGPYILYVSNALDAPGSSATPPPSYEALVASTPPEHVDFVAATLRGIAERPAVWLRLVARKVGLFFAPAEIPNNTSYAMARQRSPWLRLAFVDWPLVLPWAVVGLGLALRRPRSDALPLVVFVATYLGGTVAFYVLGRLRQPAMLILVVLAALAVDRLLALGRVRFVVAATTLILLGLALRPDPDLYRPTDALMASAASANRARERLGAGNVDGAREDLLDALVLHPASSDADRLLRSIGGPVPPRSPAVLGECARAKALIDGGRRDEAVSLLEELARSAPDEALPLVYLANLRYLEGDRRRSLRALEGALRRSPFDADVRRNLEVLRQEVLAEAAGQST